MNTTPLSRSPARCGLLGLLLATLPAQDPATSLPRPATSPIVAGPLAPDGTPSGTWASGTNYKVRFDGGMTFHPHVGADLPHQPFAWRTVSVRCGDTECLPEGLAPALRHDALCAEYDFGPVRERYEVRGEGLAQSFVLTRRPAAGDLVITGVVHTPLLLAARPAAHAPLTLHLADGRAVIEYGVAVAIDADGTTTPMTTAVLGDRIELRLPAAALASATFPLVVDPLIANTLLRQGAPIDEVDVLHESLSSPALQARLWVAESRTIAANDRDTRVYRYSSAFGGAGFEVFREISGWDTTHPRLAPAPAANRVVVVMSLDTSADRVIWVHRHDVADTSLSTSGDLVPRTGNESHWRPDVGGRRGGGSRVLIVFQREGVDPFAETATSEVRATVFDAANPAAPFVVAPFPLRPAANRDQERPVVDQVAASNDWLVAFQEHNGNVVNDDWDIEVLSVTGTGLVGTTPLSTEDAGDITRHKVGPQLAGSNGRYLLTYATRTFDQSVPKPTSPEGQVVRAQRIDWDLTTSSGTRPWPAVDLLAPGIVTVRTTGLAHDSVSTSHWCAGVRNDSTSAYRVLKLGYTGHVVETGTLGLAAAAIPQSLAIAFNQEQRNFPIVFAENDGSTTTNALQGTQMQYAAVAPPALLGFACGSGVWNGVAALADRQQIGAQALPLQLTGAPVDTAAILFVSTGTLPIDGGLLGAPGCTLHPDLLLPNYLGSVGLTIVNGACATTLDLPENLAPLTLTMQWVYLVPGANALGLLASEGLSVPVGR